MCGATQALKRRGDLSFVEHGTMDGIFLFFDRSNWRCFWRVRRCLICSLEAWRFPYLLKAAGWKGNLSYLAGTLAYADDDQR